MDSMTPMLCVDTQLVGLGMVACGAWFHASVEVHAYLTVFVTGAHDSTLVAIAAVMLVTGIILTLISALAIVGLLLNKPLFIFIVRKYTHYSVRLLGFLLYVRPGPLLTSTKEIMHCFSLVCLFDCLSVSIITDKILNEYS